MNVLGCDAVQDLLPLALGGRLERTAVESVEAHVATCDECRAAADVLAVLQRHPIHVPQGLAERVTGALIARPPVRRLRMWPVAAAASVAGALFVASLLTQRGPDAVGVVGAIVLEDPPSVPSLLRSAWPGDEGLLAADPPVLDDLTVEELELLLAELES